MTLMELIFLNSITPGNHIWGMPLRFKRTEDFNELYQKTIEGLVQKHLLESETKLSILGAAAAKLVDDYKRAERYVIFNRLHIALLSDYDGAVIVQTEPGCYEILRQNRAAILLQILEQYEELCAAGKRLQISTILSPENFLKEISKASNNILLGKYDNNRSVEEGVLFWDNHKIYYYDVKRERKHRMSAPQVRNLLADILELREEEVVNG
ncbi:MAG: DUF5081 family protein [Acetatifactor sp.]|nr:DUF5081 family protein [Acetatifactor sp.]